MAGWNNTGSSAKCVDMRPEGYKHITEGCCPYRRIALSLRFFQPFQPFQSFQPPQFCYIVTCYNKVVPHVTFVRRPPPTTSPTRPCPKINIRREGLVRRPKGGSQSRAKANGGQCNACMGHISTFTCRSTCRSTLSGNEAKKSNPVMRSTSSTLFT